MENYLRGSATMATKNDERVLQLKQVIDKKKMELKGAKKIYAPDQLCP